MNTMAKESEVLFYQTVSGKLTKPPRDQELNRETTYEN